MPPAGDVSPGMLSVPVSLTPLPKRCCLVGVSQFRLHPPTRLFPTDRLPSVRFAALQTVLLAHYDFLQLIPHASFVTSRSVIRLVVYFRSRWQDNRRHRAGHLFSRYAPRPALFPENCRISQVPMKPLRPADNTRPARTCAPLYDPGRTSMPHHCGLPGAAHNSRTSRTSTMRQFRGSITRPGARCLRFVPSLPSTTQDSLTAGG